MAGYIRFDIVSAKNKSEVNQKNCSKIIRLRIVALFIFPRIYLPGISVAILRIFTEIFCGQ